MTTIFTLIGKLVWFLIKYTVLVILTVWLLAVLIDGGYILGT